MGADAVAVATGGILAGPAPASDPDPPVRGRELHRPAAPPGGAGPTGTIRGVSEHPHPAPATTPEPALTVLVYSDDRTVRAAVRSALGRRPAAGLPPVEYVECATEPAVIARMDAGGVDLAVLDGEAAPAGGMGICRQLKDEIYRCPPVLVLVGRPQDAWLATWSRADAVVSHPLDPVVLAQTAAGLLATRAGHEPSPTIA
jgi:CheY-like chemotaxis protein